MEKLASVVDAPLAVETFLPLVGSRRTLLLVLLLVPMAED